MYSTARPATVRRLNRRAVIRFLQQIPHASRADCAKALKVSQPTVGKIANQLLAQSLLEEVPAPANGATTAAQTPGRMGRPGQLLRLNRTQPRLILIELGVEITRLAAAPVGLLEEDIWTCRFPTPPSPQRWRAALREAARHLPRHGLWGALLSVPGVVDESAGQVLLSPGLHWTEKVNLATICREVWPIPTLLVQEIRALALGQLRAELGAEDFLLVDVGAGVGAAAIIGRQLHTGSLPLSGELGHTPVLGNARPCGCGAVGCLETLISRPGLLHSFAQASTRAPCEWDALLAHVRRHGLPDWLRASLDAAAGPIAAALNTLGLRRVVLTGALTELPPIAVDYLTQAIIRGSMWARFGQVTCQTAPRRRALGLVTAAIDRLVLGLDSPSPGVSGMARNEEPS